ncbi:hypothetical protein [Aurantimonas sp. NFXS3]
MWRPVISEPPLCTPGDLNQWVTLTDLIDMHEALDLKGAMQQRAMEKD